MSKFVRLNATSRIAIAACTLLLSGIAMSQGGASAASTTSISAVKFGAPLAESYDHTKGGGVWNDGSVSYIKGELLGRDFNCGDYASFMLQLESSTTGKTPPLTVKVVVDFTVDSTGRSGVAIVPDTSPAHVKVQSGVIKNAAGTANIGTGAGGLDSGNNPLTPAAKVATSPAPSVSRSGTIYTTGSYDRLTYYVTNLGGGQDVVIRMDAKILCQPGSSPTGNLQAALKSVTVVSPAPDEIISSGNQTVNFRDVDALGRLGTPELVITKTVIAASGDCANATATELTVRTDPALVKYCYTVTNIGGADATNAELIDDNATPSNADDVTIFTGQTIAGGGGVRTGEYTPGGGLAAPGPYTNIATVTATGATTKTATATVTIDLGLDIQKALTPDTQVASAVGQVITFTLSIVNGSSTKTYTDVTPGDANATITSCTPTSPATLAPGATMSCTATHTVTQADLDAGEIVNTAYLDGKDGGTPVPRVITEPVIVPVDDNPELRVFKSQKAGTTTPTEVGGKLYYTIRARNVGNVTLTAVVIEDTIATITQCSPTAPATLAPDELMICTAEYTLKDADLQSLSVDNTATATGSYKGIPVTTKSSNKVTITIPPKPHITVTIKQTSENPKKAGDRIVYEIRTKNTGGTKLEGVNPPPNIGVIGSCTPARPATLMPGETMVCTAGYIVTPEDVKRGYIDNKAFTKGSNSGTTVRNVSNVVRTPIGEIPATGSNSGVLAMWALLALAMGLALLGVRRRRAA